MKLFVVQFPTVSFVPELATGILHHIQLLVGARVGDVIRVRFFLRVQTVAGPILPMLFVDEDLRFIKYKLVDDVPQLAWQTEERARFFVQVGRFTDYSALGNDIDLKCRTGAVSDLEVGHAVFKVESGHCEWKFCREGG